MDEQKINIGFSGVVPGEALVVAILNFSAKVRETMSQPNRDRLDTINIQALEDWRKFWVRIGLIKED